MNKFYCLLIIVCLYHTSITPSFDPYDNTDYSQSIDFLCGEEIPVCEKLTKAQQEFLRLRDTYSYKIGVTLQFSSLQAQQDCSLPIRKKILHYAKSQTIIQGNEGIFSKREFFHHIRLDISHNVYNLEELRIKSLSNGPTIQAIIHKHNGTITSKRKKQNHITWQESITD